MQWYKAEITIPTQGKGFYPLTERVNACVAGWSLQDGMCFLFLPHTSASLVLSEDYDPSVKVDELAFLEARIPDGAPQYTHRLEGADDASSHLRSMVLPSNLTIPVAGGRLALGTWQGVTLLEHRKGPRKRTILVQCLA